MRAYETYLFDGDGTLFDTADLVVHCFQYVAEKHCGVQVSREAILDGYGLPLRGQLVKQLGADQDIDTIIKDFIQYQIGIIDKDVRLFPGVHETLDSLKKQGAKLAVVTSRKPFSLGRILEHTGIGNYFDTLVTPDDTTRHKPDAAPALLALSRLDRPASTALFIGDSQYDILSGNHAGTDTAFVNWSHLGIETIPLKPTWRLDKMSDLLVNVKDSASHG